jgi:hypothetical protein
MRKPKDFEATFLELKKILKAYEDKLIVVADTSVYYALETPHVMKNKHRLYFAGVRIGKAYVSFHLMPVYVLSELREGISPELRKRMQGKSCFNFSTPEPKLFKELAKLTKTGFRKFMSKEVYSKFMESKSA